MLNKIELSAKDGERDRGLFIETIETGTITTRTTTTIKQKPEHSLF